MNKNKIVESVKTTARSLFNTPTLIIIIITVALTYFLLPSKETISYKDKVVVKPDEAKIASLIRDYEKKLTDQQSWYEKLLGQKKPSKPPTGTVGKPDKPPIEEVVLPPIGDSTLPSDTIDNQPTQEYAYPYDLALSIDVTQSEINILTMNPYLQKLNKNYVKSYKFPRDEEDFTYIATTSFDENALDGANITFSQRAFVFDGVFIGGGTGIPRQWYLSLDAEFTIYKKLKLIPKITTSPFIGIDVRYRLFK